MMINIYMVPENFLFRIIGLVYIISEPIVAAF